MGPKATKIKNQGARIATLELENAKLKSYIKGWQQYASSLEGQVESARKPWMGCPEFQIVCTKPPTLKDAELMAEWLNLYLRHRQSMPSI